MSTEIPVGRLLALTVAAISVVACHEAPVAPVTLRTPINAAMAKSAGTVVLHVDAQSAPNGDGSGRAPFQDLGAAVALANQLGGAHIVVAPGRYDVNATIRIETPVSIIGSNVMQVDADGLPTGAVEVGTESRIVATGALGASALMIAGRTDGVVLHDVTIANLTLESQASSAYGLQVTKAQDFTIRNNIFMGPAAIAIGTAGSSGNVRANYVSGAGCGACVMAGSPGSPAVVDVRGNRMVGNSNGGVLLNGSGTDIDEFADELQATVAGNDLSDNTAPSTNQGFGVRIFIIRRDLTSVMNTQSTGHIRAVVEGNRIVHNKIGVVIDAGFPYRRVGSVCDPRTYSGSIDVTLRGNTLSSSILTPALITFTRNTNTLTTTQAAQWQYLHNSSYTISDPDGTLAGYWYDHPAADPFLGPCANDAGHELLANQLIYNGVEVLPGRSP
jgi:Right handed beta helix region